MKELTARKNKPSKHLHLLNYKKIYLNKNHRIFDQTIIATTEL